MSEPTNSSVKRVWRLFAIAFTILVLLLVIGFCYASCHFPVSDATAYGGSLLGGPGGVTMLAIIVALSAYLRAVASTAEDRRDKLISGDSTRLYSNPKAREKKLESLNHTSDNMHVAAPFLMLLSLALALRLWIESVTRGGLMQGHHRAMRITDFLIMEWLVLAFFTLCVLHFFAWHRDERIRQLAGKSLGGSEEVTMPPPRIEPA